MLAAVRSIAAAAATSMIASGAFAAERVLEVHTSPAKLSRTAVPATGRQTAILEVERFGRFSVRAKSPQGTGIQVVNKMTGPSKLHGAPGESDGRIDLFLDRGSYKVIAHSDDRGTGEAALAVSPFRELHAPKPPALVETKPFSAGLDDLQQISFWLEVREARMVAIEAAGRNLADLRFWKDGTWLVDAEPETDVVQPVTGRPLAVRRLFTRLEPGLYLLTAYGGPSQPWAEESKEHPFHLRFGIPRLPSHARARHVTSELGYDRFVVPAPASYFRLELPEAKPATIQVVPYGDGTNPYSRGGHTGAIEKNSVPPATELRAGGSGVVVTVTAGAGQPYVLQHFQASNHYVFDRGGAHWVSTIHSGPPGDSVDATAIVARTQYADEDYRVIAHASDAVTLDGSTGWKRRFNLLEETTVFLDVKSAGTYEVRIEGEGVTGAAKIEPFFVYRPWRGYEPPPFQPGGGTHGLDPGLHVLTIRPEKKGIATVTVKPPSGWLRGPAIDDAPPRAQVRFPSLDLDYRRGYGIWVNDQPGVETGIVLRRLPVDLVDALPVTARAGDEVTVPSSVPEEGTIRAIAEDGTALEISVNGAAWSRSANVKRGEHTVRVRHASPEPIAYSIGFEAKRLMKGTPLPELPDSAANLLPDFPVLEEKRPVAQDVERSQRVTFLVKAESPALYRVETTGLLATEGNVRTRTITLLDRQAANGVGRNFLVQQYLREGDYQLTAGPTGLSRGRMGVRLAKTPVVEGGTLLDGVPARIHVRPGEAVSYTFEVAERAVHVLSAMGLGRTFRGRLEDEDGWPIVAPNGPAHYSLELDPGKYRLVVLPEPVEARQVTRLVRMRPPVERRGHGPHVIAPGEAVTHEWLEPEEAGAPRVPDVWELALPAATDATVSLDAEMTGSIVAVDGGARKEIAVIPPERGWRGRLAAGRYRVELVCSRVNNRVPYTLSVQTDALLAGMSRTVSVPARLPVAVGSDALVELSSFGGVDVRAELAGADGRRIAANDDRPGDWNFHIGRTLAAGEYELRVEPVGAGYGSVSVSLDVPDERVQEALRLPAKLRAKPERGVLVYPLRAEAAASVVVVAASAPESVGVALEARDGGAWKPLGSRIGRDARLEVPIAGAAKEGRELRLRVWSVDRRGGDVTLAVAAPEVRIRDVGGAVALERVTGVPGVAIGAVRIDPGVVRVDEEGDLRASVGGGLAAEPIAGGLVAVPGGAISNGGAARPERVLWLVSSGEKPRTRVPIERVRVRDGAGEGLALVMPPRGPLVVDLATKEKGPLVVLARARRGQPGLAAGTPARVRAGTFAAGTRTAVSASVDPRGIAASIWDASPEAEPLEEVRVRAFAFGQPRDGGALAAGVVEDALGVRAAATFVLGKDRRVRLSAGDGVVFVLHDPSGNAMQVVGGTGEPVDETLEPELERVTVLCIAGEPRRFRIEAFPIADGQKTAPLLSTSPFERAAVSSGAVRVPFTAGGDGASVLRVRGGEGDALALLDGGAVLRGRDLALPAGASGELVVRHDPGWLLAAIEPAGGAASSFWGEVQGGPARPVEPPVAVTLSGAQQAIRVQARQPSVLHLRAAVPAAVRVARPAGAADVDVFPRGVVLDAWIPAGATDVTLRGLGGGSLGGVAEVRLSTVTPLEEGVGAEVLLPPGGTRMFSFTVSAESEIGVGVRADADVVEATLLDASGRKLGTGVVQMHTLAAGTYLLSVHVAEDARPARVRPAVVGLERPDTGPPPEIVRTYLEEAGAKRSAEITP